MLRLFFVFLPVCCFLVTGCGEKSLPVNSVTGQVTLDGQPFDDVTITFTPISEGEMSFAATDAQGKYALSTLGAKPQAGAMVGEYGVSFDKTVPDGARPTEAELADPDFEPAKKYDMDKMKQMVPAKYTDSSTSGFTVKVEKGKNEHNFDLLSK